MRSKLTETGLHHAQAMVLFHLWHKDGIAQNALAGDLNITPPTATNTLQRMERDGWISRSRDTKDQRVVRVYLTEKAKALRNQARISFQELDDELTSVLTKKECHIFLVSLKKVHHYLSRTYVAAALPDAGRTGNSPGDEAPAVKSLFRLFALSAPLSPPVDCCIALVEGMVAADLTIPRLTQRVIDHGIMAHIMSVIISTALWMVAAALISALLALFNNYLSISVALGLAPTCAAR